MKTLYRSSTDRKLGGVIAGLGEYFNIDANLLRIATLLLCFFTAGFPVLITYFVAWFIIEEEPLSLPQARERAANENDIQTSM